MLTLANNENDKSGLYSLSGFAYQIKVFFYYAMLLQDENSTIEFESLDDIAIKNVENFDDKDTTFISKIKDNNSFYQIIQVKYTKINEKKTKDLMLRWVLAAKNNSNIRNFILFTDENYSNKNLINQISAKELYRYVISAKKEKSNSIKSKIKLLFFTEGTYKDFCKLLKKIKANVDFINSDKIDEKIKSVASVHFKRNAVSEIVYCARLVSALKDITYNIMQNVLSRKPYILNLSDLNKIEEKIIQDINETMPVPLSYAEFKKGNPINIDSCINNREYRQLEYCELPLTGIKRNLQQCCYYVDFRHRLLAMGNHKKVADIELQSFENFERVQENLEYNNCDTPRNRLDESQKIENKIVPRAELSLGTYIYLTKEKEFVGDNQISWKDEDE